MASPLHSVSTEALWVCFALQGLSKPNSSTSPSTRKFWCYSATRKCLEINDARVAKLADAPDLGSGGAILRGSSPLPGSANGSKRPTLNFQHPMSNSDSASSTFDVRRWTFDVFCAPDPIVDLGDLRRLRSGIRSQNLKDTPSMLFCNLIQLKMVQGVRFVDGELLHLYGFLSKVNRIVDSFHVSQLGFSSQCQSSRVYLRVFRTLDMPKRLKYSANLHGT